MASLSPIDASEAARVVVAKTVYGEARGEGADGQAAVAWVIRNRTCRRTKTGGPYWWGGDLISVCRKPYQFSCWLASDPNRAKLDGLALTDPTYLVCRAAVDRVFDGQESDPTNGATSYYATDIPAPKWAANRAPSAHIGHHIFFVDP